MSLRDVFLGLQQRLDGQEIKGLNATFQFELEGNEEGVYHIIFIEGSGKTGEGAVATPNLTVTMNSDDFRSMLAGELNPAAAFMGGKLKVKGDMGLAMKLQTFLS
ncbi:MAG: SCP2 sterol-binding domain-containing protein [Dethiobacteraceae bacterium]